MICLKYFFIFLALAGTAIAQANENDPLRQLFSTGIHSTNFDRPRITSIRAPQPHKETSKRFGIKFPIKRPNLSHSVHHEIPVESFELSDAKIPETSQQFTLTVNDNKFIPPISPFKNSPKIITEPLPGEEYVAFQSSKPSLANTVITKENGKIVYVTLDEPPLQKESRNQELRVELNGPVIVEMPPFTIPKIKPISEESSNFVPIQNINADNLLHSLSLPDAQFEESRTSEIQNSAPRVEPAKFDIIVPSKKVTNHSPVNDLFGKYVDESSLDFGKGENNNDKLLIPSETRTRSKTEIKEVNGQLYEYEYIYYYDDEYPLYDYDIVDDKSNLVNATASPITSTTTAPLSTKSRKTSQNINDSKIAQISKSQERQGRKSAGKNRNAEITLPDPIWQVQVEEEKLPVFTRFPSRLDANSVVTQSIPQDFFKPVVPPIVKSNLQTLPSNKLALLDDSPQNSVDLTDKTSSRALVNLYALSKAVDADVMPEITTAAIHLTEKETRVPLDYDDKLVLDYVDYTELPIFKEHEIVTDKLLEDTTLYITTPDTTTTTASTTSTTTTEQPESIIRGGLRTSSRFRSRFRRPTIHNIVENGQTPSSEPNFVSRQASLTNRLNSRDKTEAGNLARNTFRSRGKLTEDTIPTEVTKTAEEVINENKATILVEEHSASIPQQRPRLRNRFIRPSIENAKSHDSSKSVEPRRQLHPSRNKLFGKLRTREPTTTALPTTPISEIQEELIIEEKQANELDHEGNFTLPVETSHQVIENITEAAVLSTSTTESQPRISDQPTRGFRRPFRPRDPSRPSLRNKFSGRRNQKLESNVSKIPEKHNKIERPGILSLINRRPPNRFDLEANRRRLKNSEKDQAQVIAPEVKEEAATEVDSDLAVVDVEKKIPKEEIVEEPKEVVPERQNSPKFADLFRPRRPSPLQRSSPVGERTALSSLFNRRESNSRIARPDHGIFSASPETKTVSKEETVTIKEDTTPQTPEEPDKKEEPPVLILENAPFVTNPQAAALKQEEKQVPSRGHSLSALLSRRQSELKKNAN